MDFNVSIPRRAAIDAGLAIARGTNPHAVVDAGRNLDLQRLVFTSAPHPVARRARVGDLLARAVACGTCLLDAEKPLLHTNRAIAATGMAGLGLGAGLGARAVAGVASFPTGHPDFRIETGSGLFQAYIERVFPVGAAKIGSDNV